MMHVCTLLYFPSPLHAILSFDAEEDKGLDDMYEIEDYEDKISVQRGKLWILTLFLFLGYLFCAGYAYYGAKTADGRRKHAECCCITPGFYLF